MDKAGKKMSAQSFFNKTNQVTAKELIDFLEHNQSEVSFKIKNQFVKTNISSKKDEKKFTVLKFSNFNFSNEPVVCTFQVKEDRYFFNSFLNSENIGITLDISEEIYHLQRRNDYRVAMPVGVVYTCEIQSVNEQKSKIKTEIRDISLGGCQLSIKNTTELKSEDLVELYLKLDRFEFTSIKLTIKHVKKIEGQDYTLLGASLVEPTNQVISELQSMLMFLDRMHRRKSDD